MTRNSPRFISLDELCARSTHVVVVERAEPATRSVTIDEPSAEHPFTRWLQRYVVCDALSAHALPLVGQTIEVADADWRTSLYVHVRYHRDGVGKSVLYDRYDGPPAPRDEPRVILFLREDEEDGFSLVAAGAMERLDRRATVEEALAARRG